MSDVVLTTGETARIYGTLEAAKSYIATKYGEAYAKWRALPSDDDDRKRTLATAAAFLDAQAWRVGTFDDRDAIDAFAQAQYELAVMVLADPSIVEAADQGSNIQSVSAGSASVTYFAATTKDAAKLPPILMRLVGSYLAAGSSGAAAPRGQSGACVNPFSARADLDRREPY